MEESIGTSDFVLIVCTPDYATKANDRTGGVGYEAMIITSQLAQRIRQNKFIPVLRSGEVGRLVRADMDTVEDRGRLAGRSV